MLEIRLFGGFQLSRDGLPLEMRKSRRADSLIAYLAVNLGKLHQREALVNTLCVDMQKPSDGFRTVLKFARDALGSSPIHKEVYLFADKTHAKLINADDLRVDVSDFNTPVSLVALPISTEALVYKAGLYLGPFLAGYESEEYNEGWVMAERARLETRFDQLMKLLVDRLLQDQHWNDVLNWAEHWLRYAGLPEGAYAALMMAYARLGDLGQLTETLDRYDRDMSTAELRLSDDVLALYRRLKVDLEKDRHIGVDTKAAFAPTRPRELPRQSTTFVGRESNLQAITADLSNPNCRLLTLVGLGGVGKTRLALEAAQLLLADFPDGVAYVEMARVKSAESFFSTLADALNFSPYGQESLQTQITNYLREKTVLLVLDACEHVLDIKDVDFDVVTLIEQQLLASASKIKIIATSRRRLRSNDERVIDLEGLDYPGRTNIVGAKERSPSDYDSVRLFLQIARNRKHDFDVQTALPDVLRICQKVQGMPLAIALAAAQIRFFPCSEIVEELTRSLDLLATEDTLPEPRQRTVRAAFDYAWEQLNQDEQAVFRSLAVFPGNFSLEAARKVANAPLNVLRSLVDWSLLQLDGTRYQLHDLLRQFGGQKLSSNTELDVYQRLIGYYLGFAQNKHTDYAALEPEWANLLVGMRTAYEGHQWQTVIDYAQTLNEPWFTRGRFTEMRLGMKWGCDAATTIDNQIALAEFLRHQGRACIEQASYEEADKHLTHSLNLYQSVTNMRGVALVKFDLARIAIEQSKYNYAEYLLSESKSIQEGLNDLVEIGEILYHQSWIQHLKANYDNVESIGQKALEIQKAVGDERGSIRTLRQLAESISVQGNQQRAQTYCDDALFLCERIQDQSELGLTLYTMSQILRRQGKFEDSVIRANQSLEVFRVIGNRKMQSYVLLQLSYISENIGKYPQAMSEALQSLELCKSLNDQWALVPVLSQLGDLQKTDDQHSEATMYWREALELADKLQHPNISLLRKRLGVVSN